ncbi:MAG: tripartite tricarboxylate transporter substrate binding protein [Acetobacteraceae bacterium]|nr:tripartite tricarboxylate transporter substrate binding protein [Acetobacteraceae bacterium]MCX7686013.1 tripartite tricarboxylate transporter substrate binding protein [Acetobacteraceae bacterium]MDW8398686.1 tripartite tricarboxylate transporter substrate binding protein [Acetobacteraceae bacterium]
MTTRRALLAGLLLLPIPARAQGAWPERPIRLIVPFPPGGLTDVLGRFVADVVGRGLPQPVVVENRPGGGTLVGAQAAARAAPDGHTLLIATSTTLGIGPAMRIAPPVTFRDFAPIAMLGTVTFYLVVRPDFPAQDVRGFVAAIRARPGGYSYASPGIGTAHHLLMEMLKQREGLDIPHVPYQGSTQAVTDMIGGRMDAMWLDAAVALPQLQAGRLRALAVSGPERHEPSPGVPTLSETYEGLALQAWQTVVAPAGTPQAVIRRLNAAVNAALNDAEMAGRLRQVGVTPMPMTPEALAALIESDAERWAALVRAAGIPPQ